MILIGLTGHAGSGKDTVRNIMETEGFVGLAFADGIRGMLRELLTSVGIDDACIDERTLKEAIIPELGVSYRHMAQSLGTEWARNLRRDFWLRIAAAFVVDQMDAGETHFVISDVRFANEAEWVRNKGGQIWRIHREGLAGVRPHVSESGIDNIKPTRTIHNNGSTADLAEAVALAIESLA
jgi:hypothetical protein